MPQHDPNDNDSNNDLHNVNSNINDDDNDDAQNGNDNNGLKSARRIKRSSPLSGAIATSITLKDDRTSNICIDNKAKQKEKAPSSLSKLSSSQQRRKGGSGIRKQKGKDKYNDIDDDDYNDDDANNDKIDDDDEISDDSISLSHRRRLLRARHHRVSEPFKDNESVDNQPHNDDDDKDDNTNAVADNGYNDGSDHNDSSGNDKDDDYNDDDEYDDEKQRRSKLPLRSVLVLRDWFIKHDQNPFVFLLTSCLSSIPFIISSNLVSFMRIGIRAMLRKPNLQRKPISPFVKQPTGYDTHTRLWIYVME
jgi:hypothetical protein